MRINSLTHSADLEGVHDLLAKFAAQLAQLGDGRGRHQPRHTLQRHNGLLGRLVHARSKFGQDLIVSHACNNDLQFESHNNHILIMYTLMSG